MAGPGPLRRLFRLAVFRRGVQAEVDDELRFHLESRADELTRTGLSPAAALAQARAEFGDLGAARRELAAIDQRREARASRLEWWRGVLVDARIALRSYRRQPGFTLVVLLTLALGIGATTAMFSIVHAVLLRPLPYRESERLVRVWETQQSDVSDRSEGSYPNFLDWRAERSVFSAVEAYDETNVTVSGAAGAERVGGARVTSGFFGMLGVAPLRGGLLTADDDGPGGGQAVVLGHGFWVRRFASDPGIVGKSITIDGAAYQIRGVLPPSFRFVPAGNADLWLPLGRSAGTRSQRFNHWVNAVGRLQDGVSLELAEQRLNDLMRRLATQYPETNSGRGVQLVPLREEIVANLERPILVLFGAVGMVLLIACANVASLLVARSIERSRELAVRTAIGASRPRLVRQLVTEYLVLAVAGAGLGAWVASQGVRLLAVAIPASLFESMLSLRDASVDWTALGFAIAIALLTGIGFGLAPALLASRHGTAELLHSDARSGTGRRQHRLRDALVTAEIALTLVLLVGAVLMGKSLLALLRVDPGFRAGGVATVRVALAGPNYPDETRQQQFFEAAVARVRALPGVAAVGAITNPPLQGGGTNTFHVDGAPEPDPASRPEATTRAVAGDYFTALGIPVLEGRALGPGDDLHGAPYVVVLGQSLARRLFGARPALGERLRFYAWEDSAWTIVGVVGDVKTDALDRPVAPTIYYSHLQGAANRMTLVARVNAIDAASLIPVMQREVHEVDPTVAVYRTETMAEWIANSPAVSNRRYLLGLLGGFALTALALALIGVYGVIAYAVTQRTREIAIRMALGAQSGQVVNLVLRNGLRLVGIGVLLGAAGALGLTRTLSALLFGVSAGDARTYALVAGLLVLIAAIAGYLPARRATRCDPALVLRSE